MYYRFLNFSKTSQGTFSTLWYGIIAKPDSRQEISHFQSCRQKMAVSIGSPLRQIWLNTFKTGRKAQFSRMVTEDTLSLSICVEFIFTDAEEGTKPGNTFTIHVLLKSA